MRGNPPFQLTIVLIGFIFLAIPLAKLTFARTVIPPAPPASKTKTGDTVDATATEALLRIRFAHQPQRISILSQNKLLAEFKGAALIPLIEQKIKLTIPKDGLELILNAEWPDGTPDTALTIELEPDGLDSRSLTRWSSNTRLNEVISFTW